MTEHVAAGPIAGPSIAFITLTNNGYIDYTLNCLKSLEQINSPVLPVCYCVGEEAYKTLHDKGYECVLLADSPNGNITDFHEFKSKLWNIIMFKKLEIIHTNLLKYKYVLYTDGDIIFENPDFFKYIIDNINSFDLLIQNDMDVDISNKQLCAGFFCIASNQRTLKLFNPKSIISKAINNINWDDQTYINSIKSKLKFAKLPLDLFPNGRYYYLNSDKLTPMMVHFNWVKGHVKKAKMQEHGKWYLENSPNKNNTNDINNNQ